MTDNVHFSRRILLKGGLSAGLLVLAGCQTETARQPIEPGYSMDVTPTVLPLINKLRADRKLPALFHDPIAANAAKDQAIRMARFGKMSHYAGSDESFLDRMKRLGVTLPAAENIATGQDDADRAFAAWVRSRHHLDNMLGPYRGVGMALSVRTGQGDRPFWSMCLSNADKPAKVKAV